MGSALLTSKCSSYDALIALGKAIEAAGGSNPLAVRDALLHVQFEGASGVVVWEV
jgi:ABC-type branched-subunit amino acid transport system substrate-binding protein